MSSLPVETFCPLGAKCEEAKDGKIHRCAWYSYVRGYDINTGDEIDHWECSMKLMPRLLIENSGMQRQTGAAVESFRNEMVKANEMSQQILLATVQETHPDIKVIEAVK